MQRATRTQIEALAPDRDLFGGALVPGVRVRSFSFPDLSDDGTLYGLELEGPRASYIDGILEDVGGVTIEGCPRYIIMIELEVAGGRELATRVGERCYPPLNGTPRLFGGFTCGVVCLHPPQTL